MRSPVRSPMRSPLRLPDGAGQALGADAAESTEAIAALRDLGEGLAESMCSSQQIVAAVRLAALEVALEEPQIANAAAAGRRSRVPQPLRLAVA